MVSVHKEAWYRVALDRELQQLLKSEDDVSLKRYLDRLPSLPAGLSDLDKYRVYDLLEAARSGPNWMWELYWKLVSQNGYSTAPVYMLLASPPEFLPKVRFVWAYQIVHENNSVWIRDIESGSHQVVAGDLKAKPDERYEQELGLKDLLEAMATASRSFPWEEDPPGELSTWGFSERLDEVRDETPIDSEEEYINEKWELEVVSSSSGDAEDILSALEFWASVYGRQT